MKKTTVLVLMLFCAALLLSGCSKKQTLPPADPFRDALALCAEADSVMMEHTKSHHEPFTYSELTEQQVIRALAEEALACVNASEMSDYSDGCEPITDVRFYREGKLIARFSLGEHPMNGTQYCYVVAGSVAQCYRLLDASDFLQKYWDMGSQPDQEVEQ